MNNIQIITDDTFSDYELFIEETPLSPKVREYTKRNNNPLLVFLAGSMLWSASCDASVLRQSINHETEFVFQDYNSISEQLSNYIEDLSQTIPQRKFTKKKLLKEILSFKSLCNSWDGYGSVPLEVDSATNLIDLLDLLDENIYSYIDEIYPNPNGTISVIWNNKLDETISLEVGNNTMSYYVEMLSQQILYFNNIEINVSESNKLAEFVKKVV